MVLLDVKSDELIPSDPLMLKSNTPVDVQLLIYILNLVHREYINSVIRREIRRIDSIRPLMLKSNTPVAVQLARSPERNIFSSTWVEPIENPTTIDELMGIERDEANPGTTLFYSSSGLTPKL
jgi:hypothetical protein